MVSPLTFGGASSHFEVGSDGHAETHGLIVEEVLFDDGIGF
jgi:hypothetical protein